MNKIAWQFEGRLITPTDRVLDVHKAVVWAYSLKQARFLLRERFKVPQPSRFSGIAHELSIPAANPVVSVTKVKAKSRPQVNGQVSLDEWEAER